MRYPSKIDWWILISVLLAPIGMIVALDRVLIRYGAKSIMVSPDRKDEFITELRIGAKL